MGLVRRRVGDTPVVAFVTDRPAWLDRAFERIAAEHGISFVDGIPELIEAAKDSGAVVDAAPADSHWNATGHALVGEAIARYLVRHRFLDEAARRRTGPPRAPTAMAAGSLP
jgi:hypothetical protein